MSNEPNDQECPKCGAASISSSPAENAEPGYVTQVSDCALCEAEWTAHYKLERVELSGAN